MEDESILNKNPQEVQDYLDDLAIAVCINGDRLEKYEKLVIKWCGSEAFANMKLFAEEVQRSVEREKFTNTSKVNLSYLGKNAGLSESVVSKITKHFEDKFAEKDREEDNLWSQCYPSYKPGYQNYLNRYPNGRYATIAQSIIADLERKEREEAKERAEREEKNFWNKCQTSDKSGFLKYLSKYPNGKYASTARSIIADLERKEKEEAKEHAEREERNFWNKCQTNDKSGFLKYLDKYPNGKYASTARSIIANLEKGEKEKEEREKQEQKAAQQMWDRCHTKDDYQRYLDRYPYGVYASKAYVEMLKAEKEEKRQKEEAPRARFAEEQKRKEKERQDRERSAEQAFKKVYESDSKSEMKEAWMKVPLFFTGLIAVCGLAASGSWIREGYLWAWLFILLGSVVAFVGQISQIGSDEVKPKAMLCFYLGGVVMTLGGLLRSPTWALGAFVLVLAIITSVVYNNGKQDYF